MNFSLDFFIRLLVKRGANVNVEDKIGTRPDDVADWNGLRMLSIYSERTNDSSPKLNSENFAGIQLFYQTESVSETFA